MEMILFVEDDPEWRSMVSGALKSVGHDVLVAQNASEAMHLVERARLAFKVQRSFR